MVKTQPAQYKDLTVVLALSNAPSNTDAIREITIWARENGFVRSGENHLAVRRTSDGETWFQSACYRLDDDLNRAAQEDVSRYRERRENLPFTPSLEEIMQDTRVAR